MIIFFLKIFLYYKEIFSILVLISVMVVFYYYFLFLFFEDVIFNIYVLFYFLSLKYIELCLIFV